MPVALTRRVVTSTDGAQLATYTYEPAGAPDHLPTIVLAHGWALTHETWLPVTERLAACGGVRVVLWDQRGHGGSTYGAGSSRPRKESVKQLGADLAAVIDALVPATSRLTLGGHSMGGMTVMAYAGLHPEVLAARVDRVLLASTAMGELHGPGIPLERQVMTAITRLRLPWRPGRLVTAGSQRRRVFGNYPRPQDVQAARGMLAQTRFTTFGAFYLALMEHDESAAMESLAQVPVTIVVGRLDRLTPRKFGRALAEAIPGAQLEVVEGIGHMTPYETPDLLVSALLP